MEESQQVRGWQEEAYAEGLKLGEARGELRAIHQMVLRLGQKKFGTATEKTKKALLAISDTDRLDRIAVALFTATSWRELLATK